MNCSKLCQSTEMRNTQCGYKIVKCAGKNCNWKYIVMKKEHFITIWDKKNSDT